MDALKKKLTGKEEEEKYCPSLSFKERMIGFAVCAVIGKF